MADAVGVLGQAGSLPHEHQSAHAPNLQHHFETPAQQFDASKLGMWLFLVTEVLFFSGLFCAYAVYRRTHPEIFLVGQHFLDVKWGAVNTVVLILSSLTMALGVWAAQTSRKTLLVVCLALTLAGAAGFMVVKGIEYSHKIEHGVVWGKWFDPQHGQSDHAAPGPAEPASAAAAPASGDHAAAPAETEPPAAGAAPATAASSAAPPTTPSGLTIEVSQIAPAKVGPAGLKADALNPSAEHGGHGELDPYQSSKHMRDLQIFLGIYFCMTGLHGIHVLGGMVVIAWLLKNAIQGKYSSRYYTPVDLVGLYWHLVDLVWIYLFPLLYLIH